jgi:ariadne-2
VYNDANSDLFLLALSPQFEYQQAQLEFEIENLSWKIERAETTDIADIRQQINRTEVKRLTLLRDFVPA